MFSTQLAQNANVLATGRRQNLVVSLHNDWFRQVLPTVEPMRTDVPVSSLLIRCASDWAMKAETRKQDL
ncbi:MAG: hypothetical protein ABJM87_02870 [Roseibium sp.]